MQCSHHLLELRELNFNNDIQFAMVKPLSITCMKVMHEGIVFVMRFESGTFPTEFTGLEIPCALRSLTSPGVTAALIGSFRSEMSICLFFHSSHSVNLIYQKLGNTQY